jgi:glucose-specific phosphotransferase system IIA component
VTLMLATPMAGWVGPLDEAPDPVFADRMLGDGLAIDPTGATLHAPCDGEIVSVARTRHAITLRADNGAEILMHIGLETVAMDGEGFTVHVQAGQKVLAGELLISFDLDLLARRAKSLLTPSWSPTPTPSRYPGDCRTARRPSASPCCN